MRTHTTSNKITFAMVTLGAFFGLWAMAVLVAGLHRVNWQVTELIRHYLVASGMITPMHTVVDFYTHIKGIEYLICVAFFVAFPMFYKYVEKSDSQTRATVQAKQ